MFPSATRRKRRPLFAVVGASLALTMAACGGVQGGGSGSGGSDEDYPTKTIEFIAPSSAGGSTDLISRAAAAAMEEPLGQSIVVENREGANGAVGGKEVLGRNADGYSLVLLFQSLLAIGPLTIDDPDAIKMSDMDVIGGLTTEDYVLVTAEDSDFETLKDATDASDIKFGTSGAGTGSQLAQVLLFEESGTKYADVPLDGGSGAVTAVLGQQVDVAAVQTAEAAAQIDAGKLKALAVFSDERIEFLPDVPTATESGFDIGVDQRRWVAAPKGLPDNVRKTLTDALETARKDSTYTEFLKKNYISPWPVSGDEVVTEVDAAQKRFGDLLKSNGVSLKAS